jgi:hypothetical protein
MKKLLLVAAIGFAFTVTSVAAAPPSLTLSASATTVRYGTPSTLSGVLSTHRSGQQISLEGQTCGTNAFKKVTTATTTTNGAFMADVTPTINTTYRAKLKGSTSPVVLIKVKPIVKLKKLSSRRFRASVTAGASFVGKYVTLQKRSGGRWVRVTRITLKSVVTTTAPTQVSSGTKRVKVKSRLRLRAMLTQSQAGTCYVKAASRTIRS